MAFTNAEGYLSEGNAVAVVNEIKTACEDRTRDSGLAGLPHEDTLPNFPDVTDTANLQETAGEIIYLVRGWIEDVVSLFYTDGAGVHSGYESYTLESLLSAAGYGEWEPDHDVENAELFVQLQNVLKKMVIYREVGLAVDDQFLSAGFIGATGPAGSGKYNIQSAWTKLIEEPVSVNQKVPLIWRVFNGTDFLPLASARALPLIEFANDIPPNSKLEHVFLYVTVGGQYFTGSTFEVDFNGHTHNLATNGTQWIEIGTGEPMVGQIVTELPATVPFSLPAEDSAEGFHQVVGSDIHGFYKLSVGNGLTYG